MVSAAGDFVYAKFSEINVMIANHCVFELSVPCVCLFHCEISTEFDVIELQPVQSCTASS